MHIPYLTIYHFPDHIAHRAYRMTYSKLHTYSRNRRTSWLSVSRFGIGDDSISITSKGFQLKAKSTDQNLFSSYDSRLLSRLPVQLSFSKCTINITENKHLQCTIYYRMSQFDNHLSRKYKECFGKSTFLLFQICKNGQ